MEHRLGARIAINIPIRWQTKNHSWMSIGRLTNVSLSGGFIADFDLRLLSRIQVTFQLPAQPVATTISAYVSRRCAEGSGIEWCEWAPSAIMRLVRPLLTLYTSSPPQRPLYIARAEGRRT